MIKPYYYTSPDKYAKALAKLKKSLRSGRFANYTQQKKQEIWKRLCRYARQLGIPIKASLAAACLAAGLSLTSPVEAQITFVEQTGAANPLNGVNVGGRARPTFVDIDGDADEDVFIGNYDGNIVYYKNTGSASAPVFTVQPGVLNPLDGVDIGFIAAPTFVDIDGDADMDVFIGAEDGNIRHYKNTGSASVPVFVAETGAANPLDGVNVGGYCVPTFVDINNDGDMDAFIGETNGLVHYYENTGTASLPFFTAQTGTANPFDGIDVGGDIAPAFVDINGDGDFDAFIGEQFGIVAYYQNTGTATVPVFTVQTGVNNPLNSVALGFQVAPAFVDIDGDGDADAFIGDPGGNIVYYQNTTIALPLRLLNFSGKRQQDYNHLEWNTADEVNTKLFEIERSSDGRNFTKIVIVNTTGNRNNHYSVNDNVVNTGKLFYRLKMVDIDGRFTYSHIIWITSDQAAGVSIYPNPATDIIYINTGTARILKTIARVYDGNGRLMQTVFIDNDQQRINVNQLAPGAYTIKFADGTVQRFMKK
ncbi:MAG: T9SS type A sorting domain-containing protein [Chitinophagaceae bacterium]|nr:T9SS type A sorting domain-containing protein [Chitinophagaceae bacterium]